MFLVKDTLEEREKKIREFANLDSCVGVLLAAANLEWSLHRCIYAMGHTSTKQLKEKELSSLQGYEKEWRVEIAKFGQLTLEELIDQNISCPDVWLPENRKSKTLTNHNSGWAVLKYAFRLRHVLIHGKVGSSDDLFANTVIDVLLQAARILAEFAEKNNAPIFGKVICRTKPFTFK